MTDEKDWKLYCPACGSPYAKTITPLFDYDTGTRVGTIERYVPACKCPVYSTGKHISEEGDE